MISHNLPISQFNPLISLHIDVKSDVAENFLRPIVTSFFRNLGGLDSFDNLESSNLRTEVEYKKDANYINDYLYKEIMDTISRDETGSISFRPKYSISFDSDLADCGTESENTYPYKNIFNNNEVFEPKIKYGLLSLGNQPVLYIIYIELQQLVRYIKNITVVDNFFKPGSISKVATDVDKRNHLIGKAVGRQLIQLKRSIDVTEIASHSAEVDRLKDLIDKPIEGATGKIRINLAWNTIDDLDLYVQTPKGTINYSNRVVVYDSVVGELDVDCNAGDVLLASAQENIFWDGIPLGEHIVGVNFFKSREKEIVRFTVTILIDDEDGRVYSSDVDINQIKNKEIVRFEFVDNSFIFKD